ncbi:MAG: metallophosphoesterase family protein, partial [Kiritimatiellaceae bacterium]|nr:metallophosphoesterase family protein [Kiritimatiellaceae bacterium]
MRKFQRWIIVCAVLAGSVVMAAVTKGPYLIYTGNPSTMTVLWQTDATQSGTLYWGTSTSYSSGNMSSTEISSSSHQHKKTITGLSPATRYYYKIVVGSTTLTGNFKSAPSSSETDIKFLVYGDTRSNPGDHNTVASRIVDVYTADSAYQTMLLHVGDLANDGNSESSWTRDFFPRNQSSILKMQSSLPIQATMGNHEGTGTLFKKYFPYPFVGDRYWSFDYGPVHVSVVDQYVGDGNDVTGLILNTAQKNWLINDLSTTTKKFKIILLHHPGWAARGGHDNNNFVMNTLHPIFKQYGVT